MSACVATLSVCMATPRDCPPTCLRGRPTCLLHGRYKAMGSEPQTRCGSYVVLWDYLQFKLAAVRAVFIQTVVKLCLNGFVYCLF